MSHRIQDNYLSNFAITDIVRAFVLITVILAASVIVSAQTLTGTVTDERGDAIVGAEVTLESGGVFDRTVTDAGGAFSFSLATGKLRVSAVGFDPVTRQIDSPSADPLTIILQPSAVAGNVLVTPNETLQTANAASIAVITIESLAVTAARAADDTLRQLAGFQTFRRSSSRTTNPTAQGANLRGLSGSGAARTMVAFDGLSINDAFGGWTYWTRVPMVAVERIDIFRGGASSYYGSDALSGAINITPFRLEDDEKLRLRFETSVASQNTGDASGILLAKAGKLEADLIGDLFQTAGYVPVEYVSRGAVDTSASSRYSNIGLKLGRRFGDKNRIFIRGNLFGERRDNGTSLTNNRTYFRQIAGGVDTASLSLRIFGEGQIYDQTFSSVSLDRNAESLTRIQRVPSHSYGASGLWRKKIKSHSLAASGEISNVRGFSDETGYSAGFATGVSRVGGAASDLSFFVQDGWDIAKRLTLNLSARIDNRRNFDGSQTTRTLVTGTETTTLFAARSKLAFSPRVGAVYEINENVSIYGAYSRSFRAPSLNELYRGFRVGNVVTQANAFLVPERADAIDGGVSAVYFDRRLIVRASIYRTRVRDPVVSVTLTSTPALITRERQNVGSTLSRGIELELEARPTGEVNLNASYQFVDATISDFPAAPDIVGRRLPQVPRHSFAAQALYRFRERWKFSTQLRATSSQFEDDRNSLRLRKLFTADARVSYQFPYFIEVFAAVENVFDSRYDIALTPVRSVAAPRSFRVGLRFDLPKR